MGTSDEPNTILEVTMQNFRGAPNCRLEFRTEGAVFAGGNAYGKTSILRGIRAALGTADVEADAVARGETEARVVLKTRDWTVTRRVLRDAAKGQPAVKVDAAGPGGASATIKRPQAFLDQQVPRGFDPLTFFGATPKEQRAMVLAALPLTIDAEALRRYDPAVPEGYDCTGHAVEVLERRRAEVYAQRTGANAVAREAERKATDAETVAAGLPAAPNGVPDVATAQGHLEAVRADRQRLLDEVRAFAEWRERSATVRTRIEELRAEADRVQAEAATNAPSADALLDAAANVAAEEERVREVEVLLARAKENLGLAREAQRAVEATQAKVRTETERAERMRHEARVAEDALGTGPRAVEPHSVEISAAETLVAEATAAVQAATANAQAERVRAAATRLRGEALEAAAKAGALDAAVQALTVDAVRDLFAGGGGIDGLSIDGDDVTLDGVSLEGLSGAEQLRFCTDLAKRLGASAGLRVLTIDGLERVDPDHVDGFLRHACEGGWQVLATYVDRGELVVREIPVAEDATVAREVTP